MPQDYWEKFDRYQENNAKGLNQQGRTNEEQLKINKRISESVSNSKHQKIVEMHLQHYSYWDIAHQLHCSNTTIKYALENYYKNLVSR